MNAVDIATRRAQLQTELPVADAVYRQACADMARWQDRANAAGNYASTLHCDAQARACRAVCGAAGDRLNQLQVEAQWLQRLARNTTT